MKISHEKRKKFADGILPIISLSIKHEESLRSDVLSWKREVCAGIVNISNYYQLEIPRNKLKRFISIWAKYAQDLFVQNENCIIK